MIEGDNLEVLKLLQKSYAGQIKVIYIDPPYNTGSDFVYPDDFSDGIRNYLELTNQAEGGRKMTSNPETSGRFHTEWLNMIYPRLRLARSLLTSNGLIFVSCDDNEIENLRFIMSEIFGEENFFAQIIVQSNKRGQTYKDVAKTHEYLVVYGRSDESSLFELPKEGDALPFEDSKGRFDLWELRNRNPKFGRHNRPNLYFPFYVSPTQTDDNGYNLISLEKTEQFTVEVTPKNSEGKDGCWRWSKDKVRSVDCKSGTAVVVARQRRDGEWNIYEKSRKSTTKPKSIWDETSVINEQGTTALGDLGLAGAFDHPKPVELIKKIVAISTEADDYVLDFFAGSGTTAHAVMSYASEENSSRRFILVQLPEHLDESVAEQSAAANWCSKLGLPHTIAELTKERIRRSAAKIKAANPLFAGDTGFRVFKLAPSNIRAWEANGSNLEESLFGSAEHLVQGRSEQDILYELLLKLGLDLFVPIETKSIATKMVYSIGGGALIACLADGLTKEVIEPLASGIVAWRTALAPAVDTRVVFKDSGFADDIAKTNMAAILTQNGISDVRSL
jgi:adenine-specific DNA-methyltransferase